MLVVYHIKQPKLRLRHDILEIGCGLARQAVDSAREG